MLVLTRKAQERLLISSSKAIDPKMTVKELFAKGPLKITVVEIDRNRVRLGIDAHRDLDILRWEVSERNEAQKRGLVG